MSQAEASPPIYSMFPFRFTRISPILTTRSVGRGTARRLARGGGGSLPKPDAVTYHRAADLRRSLTPPEARLWLRLKGGGLAGLKFRRQRPEGSYILDFYCAAARLAVEIDGGVHDQPDQIEHDRRRTAWLATQGIEVIRFRALSIRDNLEAVLIAIREAAQARLRR